MVSIVYVDVKRPTGIYMHVQFESPAFEYNSSLDSSVLLGTTSAALVLGQIL